MDRPGFAHASALAEFLTPHPALRATFSLREKNASPEGRRWPEGPDEGSRIRCCGKPANPGKKNSVSRYIEVEVRSAVDKDRGQRSGAGQADPADRRIAFEPARTERSLPD